MCTCWQFYVCFTKVFQTTVYILIIRTGLEKTDLIYTYLYNGTYLLFHMVYVKCLSFIASPMGFCIAIIMMKFHVTIH